MSPSSSSVHTFFTKQAQMAPLRVPLTEPQFEIWLSAQLGGEASCAYNESLRVEFSGPLDAPALRAALDDLYARHDALRVRFEPSGEAMLIEPVLAAPITEVDLSDAADVGTAMAAILAEQARIPFDLITGPLVRAVLLRRGPEDHVLVLTTHHIICDGWSTNVMLRELAALYEGRRGGQPAALPPAPSFALYAVAERTGAAAEADIAYWMERFATLPSPLELPSDRLRPTTKTFHGATVRETIDGSLYRSVRAAGARLRSTPFATLLAAFLVLMGRLADQEEVVVGVPTAGQSFLSQNALVGQCVNFLPIRRRWDERTTLARHIAAVQEELAEAREHPRCTLGTLVRRLDVPRDPNRLPLADVQFNLEHLAVPPSFGGLHATVSANPKASVNFDLFFNLNEIGDGLQLDCDYSTDLFDETTVRRWIGHYRTLLAALVADAGQTVVRAPVLSDAERATLLAPARKAAWTAAAERRFDELFAAQVRRRPDAIAVECGEERWSYRALDQRAEKITAYLRTHTHGARVGLLLDRSLDLLASLLAVARAGHTYVPLDPCHPPARLRAVIERSDLAALLVDGAATVPDGCAVRLIDLSRPLSPAPVQSVQDVAVAPNATAYVIYTSGSTGVPKGVEVGHAALTNLLLSMAERPGMGENDTLLAVTTIAFDIAALELLLPLMVGARVIIARHDEVTDGFALMRKLETCDVTVLQATPATWQLLLEAGFRSRPGLKMLCGGEALPRPLADRLLEGGGALWNMYGPTETTIWSSTGLVMAGDGPITIGVPVANTWFHVLDRHDQLAAPGAVGQLQIGGAGLARGYFRDPEQTAATFVVDSFVPGAQMYRTGDQARRLPNGEIQVLGRIDEQVKLRGFRVELGEIEAALVRSGGVATTRVVLRQDGSRPRRLVAYYVKTAGQPRDPVELRTALAAVLPDYMVPNAFVRLAALPLTPNGKVDLRALPTPDEAAEMNRDAPRIALTTLLQCQLGAIWREVLGLDEVGAEDDLLALGADSLHIFQIAARASRAGYPVAAKDLLRHRTIAALSAAIETAAARPSEIAAEGEPPKLSQFRRTGQRG